MRSEIKRFGKIVSEILSETCENPTYARFTVLNFILFVHKILLQNVKKTHFLPVVPLEGNMANYRRCEVRCSVTGESLINVNR